MGFLVIMLHLSHFSTALVLNRVTSLEKLSLAASINKRFGNPPLLGMLTEIPSMFQATSSLTDQTVYQNYGNTCYGVFKGRNKSRKIFG